MGTLAGGLEGDDLGVRPTPPLVPTLADDLSPSNDDSADNGIRPGCTAPSLGERERPFEAHASASLTFGSRVSSQDA